MLNAGDRGTPGPQGIKGDLGERGSRGPAGVFKITYLDRQTDRQTDTQIKNNSYACTMKKII